MKGVGVALLWVALAACGPSPRSSAGFRLPAGDVASGRAAFAELRCHACHQVAGVELPAPTAAHAVPVSLGGVVPASRTDGDLVTGIINPSHRLVGAYDRSQVSSGSLSRMGDFTDAMTVRQLVDIVAFLQSRYVVERPVPLPQ
jgi:mono/diheme cytochrome c family protein